MAEHIHFVTGRLAEHALRRILDELADQVGFAYSVEVLPITVAALMTPDWIAARWQVPTEATRVLIPGYCTGDLEPLQASAGCPVSHGPRDLRRLPEHFGRADATRDNYGAHDIEILAEINHAPQLSVEEVRREAQRLKDSGADIIDVGCEPGAPWSGVGDCVRALRDDGHRVAVDSFNVQEISAATEAGAELVLSVNSSNREAAADWDCEVVAIPDDPSDLDSLDKTVEALAASGVRTRLDAILEPIGFGFAASLNRYALLRSRYPDAEMMMGIGNLTEMTDVDSAGVNVLLLAICQELEIRSVLTTEVINWARSSVRECDLARRLVYHAIRHRVPSKHLESGLITLRDESVTTHGTESLEQLASQLKDRNIRLFAENDTLHLVSRGLHLTDRDPFRLFEELVRQWPGQIDSSHAFYLGYELAKARTALTLGKQYEQDESLDWGYLTEPEQSHRLRKSRTTPPQADGAEGE